MVVVILTGLVKAFTSVNGWWNTNFFNDQYEQKHQIEKPLTS